MGPSCIEKHAALVINERLQQPHFSIAELDGHCWSAHEFVNPPYFAPAARRFSLLLPLAASFFALIPKSSSRPISSSTINRPLYLPSPVTQFNSLSCNIFGEASTSAAGIFRTSDAESTINPESRWLCSTTRMRFFFVAVIFFSPRRLRRSMTDTILPRR